MKLVFPKGEHGQVLLNPGVNRIGSDAAGAVQLDHPEILPVQCVIHISQTGANLQVPAGAGRVAVNGKPVSDIMGLRSGDVLSLGPVTAKFLVVEEARTLASAEPDEDAGATRVRPVVPKFVLRGVSGAVFGKVFPVTGPVVIGRAAECDISVPADEMSRRHAMVKPTPDGVLVEDLGSANGTFINDKRVQQGVLKHGDELRLDAVRFHLVVPGQEMPSAPAVAGMPPATVAAHRMQMWATAVLTLAAVAIVVVMLTQR